VGDAYYGRKLKAITDRVDKAGAIFQHLRLALVNQHDGAPGPAHGERLVTLVQYQNRKVYHILNLFLSKVTSFYWKNPGTSKLPFFGKYIIV
jgi:hypothetical protein